MQRVTDVEGWERGKRGRYSMTLVAAMEGAGEKKGKYDFAPQYGIIK